MVTLLVSFMLYNLYHHFEVAVRYDSFHYFGHSNSR